MTRRPIESNEHADKTRAEHNPPVGLVAPATDPDAGAAATYSYDPSSILRLYWAG